MELTLNTQCQPRINLKSKLAKFWNHSNLIRHSSCYQPLQILRCAQDVTNCKIVNRQWYCIHFSFLSYFFFWCEVLDESNQTQSCKTTRIKLEQCTMNHTLGFQTVPCRECHRLWCKSKCKEMNLYSEKRSNFKEYHEKWQKTLAL